MKKVLAIVLLIALVLPGVFAQGGSEDSKAKQVEEVYFFNSIGAYKTLLEQEIDKWNKTTGAEKGINIVIESNIDNYGTALESMIASKNFPDLADMYARPEMLKAGYARDLSKIKGLEDTVNKFRPFFTPGVNLFGENLDKVYALPLEILPIKMVYNKELFAKAGLTRPPETIAEMVEYARIITQNGNGKYFGFGWTSMWTAAVQRLAFKAFVSSTGKFYWDSNTAQYDFRQYEPIIKALAQMYKDGSMFPTPMDQHIDPIRNRFAEGLVGMEVAPAYDVSVYTNQFPTNFEWGVFDCPSFTKAGYVAKGTYLNRGNISITTWVSEKRLPAVVEAFKFLHSDELYKTVYSNSGMIPHDERLINEVKAEGFENLAPNWDVMSDIAHYDAERIKPDRLLTLDGDSFDTVCTNVILGNTTWEKEIASLNARYNAAYKQAVGDGLVDRAIYESKREYKPW